jgi:hypothetical protein
MAKMFIYIDPEMEVQYVKLHKDPCSSAEAIIEIGCGQAVDAMEAPKAGWHYASFEGEFGYIRSANLATLAPACENEKVVANETYNATAAVAYAMNHSDNTSSGGCKNRNTTFGSAASNDCANFVSQCLCAGGLPMFDGWSYQLTGIPSGWRADTKWSLTYSGYEQLMGKKRIFEIGCDQVQPGDFIYTYDDKEPAGKKYTHVTFAVSKFEQALEGGKNGCYVCGHTTNQNHKFKELTPTKCRCYRVSSSITIGADEKRVKLPETGSGAEVLN